MGCGCKQPTASKVRTDVLLCAICPHARAGGFHACTISGQPLVFESAGGVLRSRDCPLGEHSDASGRVRWFGLLWRGIPAPRRIMFTWPIRAIWGLPPLTSAIPGCGCIIAAKAAWIMGRRRGQILLRRIVGR